MTEQVGTTFWERFDQVTERHGDRIACLLPTSAGGRRVTYAELRGAALRLAQGLAGLGLRRGEVLAAWLPNLPQMLELELAAARLGLVLLGVNTRFRTQELAHVLRASQARAIALMPGFLGIDFWGMLRQVQAAEGLPHLAHVVAVDDSSYGGSGPPMGTSALHYAHLVQEAPGAVPQDGRPGDVLNLFTTSGTTGGPKLAAHEQSSIVRHAANVARAFEVEPDGAVLCALPLCGVFGFNSAMAGLLQGATLVLQPVFNADEAVELMAAHGVTCCHATDTMLRAMLEAPGCTRERLRRWRRGAFANFTGDPLSLMAAVEGRLDVRLTGVYGSSECYALMATWSPDEPLERRALDGGRPVDPEIRVRAADPETLAALPHGTPGELHICGYNVLPGYYANPEATARAFTPDGWYRSGDLGYTTEDGGFVYLARLGDSLRLGGFLVSPGEIEDHLARHPAVQMAQVVGVACPGRGECAVAFILPRPGQRCDPDDLTAHCRAGMARYKVPAHFFLVDSFPTTPGPNGEKIQKRRLREMALERLAAERLAAP